MAALEQLNLTLNPNAAVNSNGGGSDDGNRAPRLPRWTRQEILVLIQGKKVAENRVRRGRTGGGLAFGSANQIEPKWASVSSYCKRHGVNRGPVQCRKRWSNLAGDYKKIKEWETKITGDGESFWVMRNDLRRERKLPGFFDREVYEILDGGVGPDSVVEVAETTVMEVVVEGKEVVETMEATEAAEEEEVVFDSGRTAAGDDGLFSDFEQSGQEEQADSPGKAAVEATMRSPVRTVEAPFPISEMLYQPMAQVTTIQEKQYQQMGETHTDKGATDEKQSASHPEKGSPSQEGHKRKRYPSDEEGDTDLQDQLIKVLDRNSRMLTAQLEAQNINCELDRDQRKDQSNSLVAVLNKLADALGRIADKL